MDIVKIAIKKHKPIMERASPALMESSNAGTRFWAFIHAQDGGRKGSVFFPVAGQAEPCPERAAFYAPEDAPKRCPECGAKLRRMRMSKGKGPVVHPDSGFRAPGEQFLLRETRAGGHELIERDVAGHPASLILLRPNGLWVDTSGAVKTVASGTTKAGESAPVMLAPRNSAFVFGDSDGATCAVYLTESGEWVIADPPSMETVETPLAATA